MKFKQIIENLSLLFISLVSVFNFIELLEGVVSRDDITRYDPVIVDMLNRIANSYVTIAFEIITKFGFEFIALFSMILLVIFISARDFKSLYVLLFVTIGGNVLVVWIKEIISRSRPVVENPIYKAVGYSFPSAHATLSMCFYGLLIYFVLKYVKNFRMKFVLSLVLVFIVLLVGFSRIYLGVHYPSDVFAGYLLGLFWTSFSIFIVNIICFIRAKHSIA